MTSNALNKTFIAKSSMMSAANFIQFILISLIIVAISRFIGREEATQYGMTLSVYTLTIMLPLGLMVWQVSGLAPAIAKLRKIPDQKKQEARSQLARLNKQYHGYTLYTALALLAIWLLILLSFLHLATPQSSTLWVCLLPIILCSPFKMSLQAKLQVAQKEKQILWGSLTTSVVKLLLTYLYLSLLSQAVPHPYILAPIGVIISLLDFVLLNYLRHICRSLPQEFSEQDKNSDVKIKLSIIKKIFFGSIDGIVFASTFTLAILAASQSSPRDGFLITLVVSIMRIIVIPSKQFGLVGGRMSAMGQISGIKTVIVSSLVALSTIALIIIPFYTLTASTAVPVSIILLMAIQVALEPCSGVLYGFIKVRYGPEKGVWGLFLSYLALAIPGLIILMALEISTAENVWLLLFLSRLVFTASVITTVRKNQ